MQALQKALSVGKPGNVFRVVAMGPGPPPSSIVYVVLCYVRRSQGSTVIMLEAFDAVEGLRLADSLSPMMCSDLAVRFLTTPGRPLTSLTVAECRTEMRSGSLRCLTVLEVGEAIDIISGDRGQNRRRHKAHEGTEASAFEAGFRRLRGHNAPVGVGRGARRELREVRPDVGLGLRRCKVDEDADEDEDEDEQQDSICLRVKGSASMCAAGVRR